MKYITLFLPAFLLAGMAAFAQVSINSDNSVPSPSAMLDVKSTNSGFLPPRMTQAQRDAIVSPEEGLIVICTNCGIVNPTAMSIYINGTWRLLNGYCTTPLIPTAGAHTATLTGITWNWIPVANATGYKWGTTNNSTAATDMGTATTKAETGLTCNTNYIRYIWAYNDCGLSSALTTQNSTSSSLPNSPTAGTHIPGSTQIVWNWTAVSGAQGYKWNTTNNFLTATDMGTSLTKTETGLICNSPFTRYIWAYGACGNSATTVMADSTLACSTCGISTLNINHVTTGGVAPVNKTTTYGTVTNIPGETAKCWITKNLGATQQATTVSDATEASAGWYWQFNRKQGYKNDGSTVTPAWSITSISENSDWLTANDPCKLELGTQWRLPTYTEWNNVNSTGGWTNWAGPWNSGLKLHAAGYLYTGNGVLYNRGSNGNYWSNTQNSAVNGWTLYFFGSSSYNYGSSKVFGFSVRCLRDN